MKKKIVSGILACSMVLGLAACSKPEPTDTEVPETTEPETTVETEPTYDLDSIMGFNMIDNGDFAFNIEVFVIIGFAPATDFYPFKFSIWVIFN